MKTRSNQPIASTRLKLVQLDQVGIAVDPIRMAVRPEQLERVAADHLESRQIEGPRAVFDQRTKDPPERIRLALASRTRAGPPQQWQWQIDLGPIAEGQRQFGSDQGSLC